MPFGSDGCEQAAGALECLRVWWLCACCCAHYALLRGCKSALPNAVQDAIEQAYSQDVSGQQAAAVRTYRTALDILQARLETLLACSCACGWWSWKELQ